MTAPLVLLTMTDEHGAFSVTHLPAGVVLRHTDYSGDSPADVEFRRDAEGRVRSTPCALYGVGPRK